ncbi:MAG: SRPBCC family protein [Anaerolineaceae bacterium]|nr:SRPBCC family protein [Anaerolineaceae bacterium]
MASASSSVLINQPVDKVFAYITDASNHTAWQAGLLGAQVTPAGPVALGSIYHYTTEVMGRRYESQTQVSAFEPNKKWATKTVGVPRPVETVYLFEPAGNTTRLTISMDLTGGYPAAAEGAVRAQMQKSFDEQVQRIKKIVEE